MSKTLLLAFMLAGETTAAASEPIYPEPAFFLPLAEHGLGVEGYVKCLEARGEHLGLGTHLAIDDVMSTTIADCGVVRDAAQQTMIKKGSAFRLKVEEGAPSPLSDEWFAAKIPAFLDDLEESWRTNFTLAIAGERSSERYDPAAYMASYREEAASGILPRATGQ
jgi:hypothetical protein